MFRLSAWSVALLLSATPVIAQITWIGYGSVSCGSWAEQHRAHSTLSVAYEVWVFGFLSGTNLAENALLRKPDFLENVDKSGISAWMNNYCASHPLDDLLTATIRLNVTLREKAARSSK